MSRASLFPLAVVAAFATLLIGLERISLWEDALLSEPPLRIVASNF